MRRVTGLILAVLGIILIAAAILLPTYVSGQIPATGGTVAVLFDGDLVATPATVTEVVNLGSSGRTELSLLNTIIPIAAGIAGAVALIAGIVLLVRKPQRNEKDAQRSSSRAASSR